MGRNCPYCSESSGERLVRNFLNDYNIKFESEKLIKLYKNIKVDFYFEYFDKKYIIEYNGKQHYESIEFFGGDVIFQEQQKRDLELEKYCNNNDIKLYIIKYNEDVKDTMLEIMSAVLDRNI
jgi:very-short-patch-repair endonuclease